MSNDLSALIQAIRARMATLLATGEATRPTALLLADLEEEEQRRLKADAELHRRAADLETSIVPASVENDWLLDRPLPDGLDKRAHAPRNTRRPTPSEAERGVVFVYATANATFYRAVNDRLRPGEKVRLETQHRDGTYEMTRDQFLATLPAIARSPSYQRGSDAAPGAARYVIGRPPKAIESLRAPE